MIQLLGALNGSLRGVRTVKVASAPPQMTQLRAVLSAGAPELLLAIGIHYLGVLHFGTLAREKIELI